MQNQRSVMVTCQSHNLKLVASLSAFDKKRNIQQVIENQWLITIKKLESMYWFVRFLVAVIYIWYAGLTKIKLIIIFLITRK